LQSGGNTRRIRLRTQSNPGTGSIIPPVPPRTKPINLITPADSTNGKVTDKYCWSQELGEVVIRIPIPDDVKKGKDVHVSIEKNRIEAWFKKDGIPILKNELEGTVRLDESDWTLCPGEALNTQYYTREIGREVYQENMLRFVCMRGTHILCVPARMYSTALQEQKPHTDRN
jgi:hypothetical protein